MIAEVLDTAGQLWESFPPLDLKGSSGPGGKPRIIHIFSVGVLNSPGLPGWPFAMVCVPGGVQTYRLPVELTDWAIDVTLLGPDDDDLFPGDVEFVMRDDLWHARLL